MPPLAPVITQVVPTTGPPTPAATLVATMAPDAAETDPGPFTYDKTQDPGNAFVNGGGADDQLVSAKELDGAFFVAVAITGTTGTSPEGSTTLIFADNFNPWDDVNDPYHGNPQLPPPTPEDDKWKYFLRMSIRQIVPRSRFGIDYMVARETGKVSGQAIVAWDETLLGPCPTPEIEAYAKQLSAAWPWSEVPPP